MPTGYTSIIKEGVTFEQFVLRCARAMGACIALRDEPVDIKIPVFEPSSYSKNKLKEAMLRLEALSFVSVTTSSSPIINFISITEATKLAEKEYKDKIAYNKNGMAENNDLFHRYIKMLSMVKAWQPPTPDHAGLKEFMSEQINSSIEFDCDNDYYHKNIPRLLTGEE